MDAARWKTVKQILAEAMERPEAERDPYVHAACAGDASLAAEVFSLLEHDRGTDQFLDRPPNVTDLNAEDLAGVELGPYRLIEEIGHGGMGSVYLAERADGVYQQRVAVKVIRRGMDTDRLLQRFRTERQILATLNHPNIARLLDGGALPDGRPYLVMEHVEGRRIDRYCDEERLSPAQRLRLFFEVCDAVSFAHQRLIVHRDIKPGNVLVDNRGTPKLLDFGIAKLLGPDGGEEGPATDTLFAPMTPEYASPEQISGQPVTTSTDVYALGVMLYELLTGSRPHRPKEPTAEAVLRAIRDTEPVRPSEAAPAELRRRLAGDLDVILLTALRREPERRYASVEAFASDVRRHLEGQPVLARRDSWTYRAGRYLRRNAVVVTAATLIAAALVTGTVVALGQARVARAERARAEQRQNDTLRLTNSMLFELFEGIDQGPARARQMIAERAFTYLDQLSRDAPDDARLIHEVASAYERLGMVQGAVRAGAGAGGNAAAARASYGRALRLRQRLSALAPHHHENRRQLGYLYVSTGALAGIEGRPAAALTNYRQGLALLQRAVADRPADRKAREQLVLAHYNLAQTLGSSDATANLGRPSDAHPHLVAALAINEKLLAERPDDVAVRAGMVGLHNEHAICLSRMGRQRESRAAEMRAVGIAESLVQRHPDSLYYRRELAVGYGNAAAARLAEDKVLALDLTRKALHLYQSIADAAPADADARRDLAVGHRNAGKSLNANGDPAAAVPHIQEALRLLQDLTRKNPESAFLARQLAFTHVVMADTWLGSHDPARALSEIRTGIAIGEGLMKKDTSNMVALRTLAQSFALAGRATEALAAKQPSRWSEARAWHERSLKAWNDLEKAGPTPANATGVAAAREAIARCEASRPR